MPLPSKGAPWPPPHIAPVYDQIRVDDAWYSGDKDKLTAIYGGDGPRRKRPSLWRRRRQDPQRTGRPENRLHVPFPGDIARTSADLLFAELPEITVKGEQAQARLDELATVGRLGRTLVSGGEQASGLSGVYLRCTWDKTIADRPILAVEQPDAAVPTFRFGMLREVTFWRELSGSTEQVVWRLLEHHEPEAIRFALYKGSKDNVGTPRELTAHDDTRDLVKSLDPDGDGQTMSTGVKQLTAAYVPNMLPNRQHRGAPYGRSDYAAPMYDQFDALDQTWTSWMRDIRLGRSRLIVPSEMLTNHGPGQGASFDDDREIWSQINAAPDDTSSGITENQFKIRVAEHQQTAEALIRQCAMGAGYSPESFGLDGAAVMTATEVDDNRRLSNVTTAKKARYWADELTDMLHVWLQLDARVFGRPYAPERPQVEFRTGVAESPQQTATTIELLHRAEAISTDTKVRMAHPEWDETAVAAEVARIRQDVGAAADPVGNFPMGAPAPTPEGAQQ